jgi:hypothetical protein
MSRLKVKSGTASGWTLRAFGCRTEGDFRH